MKEVIPWAGMVGRGGGPGLVAPGRSTGAKALFCLTAESMLAGEKEKRPGVEPLALATVGGSEGEWAGMAAQQWTYKHPVTIGTPSHHSLNPGPLL